MDKILLIEYDEQQREIYRARLTDLGYDVQTVSNSVEALFWIRSNRLDTVLLRLIPDDVESWSILTKLRNNARSKNISVFVIVEEPVGDSLRKALMLGVTGYLAKPFRFYDLAPASPFSDEEKIEEDKSVYMCS
jgi:DNA-binding response OmpR family regulator